VLLLRIIIFFCAENILFLRSFSEITFAQFTRKFNLTNLIMMLYFSEKQQSSLASPHFKMVLLTNLLMTLGFYWILYCHHKA
jgi:hypothetical protein